MLLVSCKELRKTIRKVEKGQGNKITGETKACFKFELLSAFPDGFLNMILNICFSKTKRPIPVRLIKYIAPSLLHPFQ